MANKFQKSVQERKESTISKEQTEVSSNFVISEAATPVNGDNINNISKFILNTPKRIAKNKTFYLDIPVIEAIKSVASEQKVTESMLVNSILSHVLGIN